MLVNILDLMTVSIKCVEYFTAWHLSR